MGRLRDTLDNYAKHNPIRFHMPGNKGKTDLFPPMSTDITELFFTDNLYNPDKDTGIIHEIEDKITKCFFPDNDCVHSVISCGGATLCVQTAVLSMIRAVNRTGKQKKFMICDRASHISLINALMLLDVEPLWIYPCCTENFIKCCEEFIKTYGEEIAGVFVTSPDYYGKIKNIGAISEMCRRYSLILTVDNSHGSHLAFHDSGTLHPINAGADISIDSIHKTLPSLTGSAALHTKKVFAKETLLRPSMRVFASTSPSFLILQSIEAAVEYLSIYGRYEHKDLLNNINCFRYKAEKIGFRFDYLSADPYRIVLSVKISGDRDINNNGGKILYDYLCEKNIVCEFYDGDGVILIPSIFNTENDFTALYGALKQFVDEYEFSSQPFIGVKSEFEVKSTKMFAPSQVLKFSGKRVSTDDAEGKISAGTITAYPPGVPLVLPGEMIDENNIDDIKKICEYIDILI